NSLYSKIKELDKEGISSVFPYQDKIEGIFEVEIENTLTNPETDLMLTNLFLFYADKVVKGVDEKTSTALEWLLPRKEVSYETLLDSTMLNPKLLNMDEQVLFRQYYRLRDVLQKYREIEKHGGWAYIDADPKLKAFKPGDTAKAILQIRERLFVTEDISQNNGSNKYDADLVAAVKKYQLRNGKNPASAITPALIGDMNIPVSERIRKIIINMERCRWISPEIIKSKELVFVNIPSFSLKVFRDGNIDFESPVVVGKTMTKTVIFSGNMSSIVFSPYWVLPKSIINSEVKPGMAKNKNYLEQHNMEWNDGQVRQKPGKNNSLGLVKFLFPNSNNIYLHDTPSKSLFARESRAFSHGCIRVGKPKDLAVNLLKDDPLWTPARIETAMHSGKESWVTLKNKIPVYIGYFTALVDAQGEISFYEDIYKKDESLYAVLTN
ncbi:MAG TPA: L,D-transpeptidase family protein, partial [Prolixibacteraceae bacterium]|nr:L,D-transpeptidase family protein [Prolixibacteraceae bacterium]